MSETRIGDWIQTYTGGKMYPLDPRVAEIDIQDIAHSLAMQCRFNGHTNKFYSVAEHSCHVHDILPAQHKLAGLLHDASEAYLCDLPRPLKRSGDFAKPYLEAEEMLMNAIAAKFGFDFTDWPAIEAADNWLLGTEALQLMAPLHPDWRDIRQRVDGLILPCWTPQEAREQFLQRYAALREVSL